MNTMETPPTLDTMPAMFGLWEVTSTPIDDDSVSFGVNSSDTDIAIWRLNLSDNPTQADRQLQQVEHDTRATQATIEAIPGKLDHLVQHGRTQPDHQFSFSTMVDDPNIGEAEAEMLRMLEDVRNRTKSGQQGPAASYGLLGSNDDWSQVGEQIQDMVNRLLRMITHIAWVETSVQDVLLGRTIIGWTGDAQTLWGTDVAAQRFNQHRRSLTLALASRHMLLRTLTVTAQGATKIAALLAIPGGPILALPVIWKYVTRVLSEIQQYQEVVGQNRESKPSSL